MMMKSLAALFVLTFFIIENSSSYAGQSGQVEFRFVCEKEDSHCDEMTINDGAEKLFLDKKIQISIQDLKSVDLKIYDPKNNKRGESLILKDSEKELVTMVLTLTEEGTQKFAQITHQNVGRRLGIILQGKLMSAPAITATITGGTVLILLKDTEVEKAKIMADDMKREIENYKLMHK